MSGVLNFLTGGIFGNGIFGRNNGGSLTSIPEALDSYFGVTSDRIAAENLAYQKEYNQQVFDRADTAFQRAASDLEKAGLSKTLAAGQPAEIGGSSSAPYRADTSQIMFSNLLGTANMLSDAGLKLAQARYVQSEGDAGKPQAEVERLYSEVDKNAHSNNLTDAQVDEVKKNIEFIDLKIDSQEWSNLLDQLFVTSPNVGFNEHKEAPLIYNVLKAEGVTETAIKEIEVATGEPIEQVVKDLYDGSRRFVDKTLDKVGDFIGNTVDGISNFFSTVKRKIQEEKALKKKK